MILKEIHLILENHAFTTNFSPRPPAITYKRPANLGDILKVTNPLSFAPTSSKPTPSPCNKPSCKLCPILTSPPANTVNTPLPHPPHATCTTNNVVYLFILFNSKNSTKAFTLGYIKLINYVYMIKNNIKKCIIV
jgi:hypothetical protein